MAELAAEIITHYSVLIEEPDTVNMYCKPQLFSFYCGMIFLKSYFNPHSLWAMILICGFVI